jgi:cytidine deaminase
MSMTIDDLPITPEEQALLAEARDLARRSVAPPREQAGALALTRDGQRFPGVAVRLTSAAPLSVCAVPAALCAARAATGEPVVEIALWVPGAAADQPCGLCLQVWRELAPTARVVMRCGDGAPRVLSLDRLLPDPFTHFDPAV